VIDYNFRTFFLMLLKLAVCTLSACLHHIMAPPATLDTQPYLKYLLHASVKDTPTEDIAYAVICEFLLQHKNPVDRFIIFPQIFLRWKPDHPGDTRAEIPDFGLGNFSIHAPHIKLRSGIEVKRCVDVMEALPESSALQTNVDIMSAFHEVFFQGEDQAKAAVKGQHFSETEKVPWLLFIGPYWTPVRYGPFSPAQLTTRTHKPSDSADFMAALISAKQLASTPSARSLYLLGTAESAMQLEKHISSTDFAAQHLRDAAAGY
jgi:hypothetical protein